MKQRQAVYDAVTAILSDSNKEFTPGRTDVRTILTQELRAEVQARLVADFVSGAISLKDTPSNKEKLENPVKLSAYVAGLITNWLNKDPNLNGGQAYQAKNPGSRAGSGDTMIKEMRLLRKQLESQGNVDGVTKVDEAIADRIAEIKKETKQPPKPIDIDALPDFLKDLVG